MQECIDSTFVSSVGKFVDRFEDLMSEITKTKKAIAVVNGTSGIEVALRLVQVLRKTMKLLHKLP